MIDKYKETLKIFRQEVELIKPHMSLDYDFEKIEPYLGIFNTIPIEEKTRYIENFTHMVWNYNDYKQKGIKIKSITKLENTVKKYQEALRDLHNFSVPDEVIFRNGSDNNYNGEFDLDNDFEIDTYLWHLSKHLQNNYLTNIELLKEIKAFNNDLEALNEASISLGLKNPSMEFKKHYFEKILSDYKIINPLDFIEVYRPNKENIKKNLNYIADEYNLNKYEMKQLIDSI